MAKTDYAALAPRLLERVGGEDNVSAMNHCATRLRFVLKDVSKADTEGIKALDGVVTVVQAGGQYQVVIGNDVPVLYEALGRITHLKDSDAPPAEPQGNLLDRAVALVSALIHPLIWTMAGAGLIKAVLALATTLKWLATESTTYIILNAAGDSLFYFLPIVLAITAARRFKANEITSVAIAGALVYPSIVTLADATHVTFLGIPVVMANYTSSLLPIIVAVWVQGLLERWLKRVLPGTIRNFTMPMIVLAVMVPMTFLTIGPVMTWLSSSISDGVQWLFVHVPWLGGAVMGAMWQVFVIFGVHWGFVPIIMTQLDPVNGSGYSLIAAPLFAAVLAQAAAMLGVMIRTRDAKLRGIAGPAALSGFLAGITEPGIYGVNLPLKRPFVYGCVGGAVGGALMALAGSATDIYVFPSIVGFPALLKHGDVAMAFIGIGVAVLISLALTLTLGFTDPDKATGQKAPGADVPAEPTTALTAPVAGTATPLEKVADPVFSSGALGNGVGIVPSDGHVLAPVAGTVVTAMDSGHAYGIRTDDGVEVLVHVGLDTVNLKGEGFSPRVGAGQRVDRGDPLVDVDLAAVRQAGYDPTTVLVVTNTASLGAVVPVVDGPVTTATTVVEIDH
ncbi:beta-glucoside-specific PTS transporter subunit IIABC [uncultured Actinomyces sp.]|jgi:PTS system, beta-glucoside-specific, IIABC component|uniref:beta-glucoside-specific PTS transporter subunit IIABC n=1 Tax=uncultured Actinomyces sp. TaxID=249061 RepID=UPI0028E83661|nr:beta-glucoside-specific PTS transporter subunit IIABC [uncultured Actinomyces sp.]